MKSITLKTMFLAVVVVCLAVFVVAFIGCSGDNGGDGSGTVNVMLSDAPLSDVEEVHVHIVRIEAVSAQGIVTLLADADLPDDIELTELAGNPLLLGSPLVDAGTYTQIRLVLSNNPEENYVILEGGQRHNLTTPSGQQPGVKLLTGEFQVVAGQTVTLLLDFDAAASVHEAGASGMWIMRPTVRASVVPTTDVDFGTVGGTVLDEGGTPLAVPEDQVLGVFMETDLGTVGVAEVDPDDGSFEVPAVLVGTYDLKIAYADLGWEPIGDPLPFTTADTTDAITELEITLDPGEIIDLALEIITGTVSAIRSASVPAIKELLLYPLEGWAKRTLTPPDLSVVASIRLTKMGRTR